jgi:Ankyrin repeat
VQLPSSINLLPTFYEGKKGEEGGRRRRNRRRVGMSWTGVGVTAVPACGLPLKERETSPSKSVSISQTFTMKKQNVLLNSHWDNNLGIYMLTPLHQAVISNRPVIVKLLLQFGADKNLPGNLMLLNGTPREWALQLGYHDIVAILESEGDLGTQEGRAGGSSGNQENEDGVRRPPLVSNRERDAMENQMIISLLNRVARLWINIYPSALPSLTSWGLVMHTFEHF